MSNLKLSALRKNFGEVETLRGIDLEVRDGEFLVFVGPSGCGKSTLLRCIAGLEEITSGTLHIDNQLVNELPPSKRGIAMVFQSYALYPHMSVAENMAFGLRLAGFSKDEMHAAVQRAAQILQIEHLLDRKPKALSGGQRQRVAIGRAIVRKPGVFLFDEPLSNLDASLRVQMRVELSRLHKELKATMVYVTHDQVEAMTLADRVAVFNAGRIEQVGSPLELYHAPANLFVAGFMGSPKMNFIAATLEAATNTHATVRLADGTHIETQIDARTQPIDASVTLGVRPEHLEVHTTAVPNSLASTVHVLENLGEVIYLYLEVAGAGASVVAKTAPGSRLRVGDAAYLAVAPTQCHLFDAKGLALPAFHQP
ncbi:MAG: sn-glycerol-3-phosphate ABC transporter ATP-binding protein UgpC [Rhodoferax sp.]|nr:sn-glycerol-3-phosphate ABC transporter ATP-binding protein UgpC [Rhodoferax sp.]